MPRTDDIRALFDAIINDDPLPEEKNADNTPIPGTPESLTNETPESSTSETPTPEVAADPGEVVDAVTTDPTSSPSRCRTRPGRTGWGNCRNELQQHGFNVKPPTTTRGR